MTGLFPEDSAARKEYPVFSGFVQYFPSAIAAIARHSYLGNKKHNPGQPLHHDRAKSDDEADAQLRHIMEGDYIGMGWRAMSLLQKHLEANGAPIAPAARNATPIQPPSPLPSGEVIPHARAAEILRDMTIERAERDDDAPGACSVEGGCE